MKPRILLDSAQEQALNAADYYERQSQGLGDKFLVAVRKTLERISYMPRACGRFRGHTRFAVVKKFPYLILFHNRRRDVLVTAIVPAASNPASWRTKP